MSAPHADRDRSEQPPSTATAGSDPTLGTSRSVSARESDEEVVDRIVDGARQLALVSGLSMREALDAIRVTADLADAARERERAESAEAERDEIAGRLSALLCELTGGRLSKTTYDVRTMVTEIDSVYDMAHQEDRAEVTRLRAEVDDDGLTALYASEGLAAWREIAKAEHEKAEAAEAERDRLAEVVARVEALADEWEEGSDEPPYPDTFYGIRLRAALSGPTPAETPQNGPEPALSRDEAVSGQSGEGEALGGAEKPCRGQNANVCVAEGCFGEACVRRADR